MKIELFNKSKHLGHFKSWLKARKLDLSIAKDLPQFGYIALEGTQGVAAGFLRQVEGAAGIIDGFITNPKATGVLRNEALDLITQQLLHTAKAQNIHRVFAFTSEQCIVDRATKHGILLTNLKLISIKLQG